MPKSRLSPARRKPADLPIFPKCCGLRVERNALLLLAFQSIIVTDERSRVTHHTRLVLGMTDVPPFDRDAPIRGAAGRQGRREHFFRIAGRLLSGKHRGLRRLFCRTNVCDCYGEEYVEVYPRVGVDS